MPTITTKTSRYDATNKIVEKLIDNGDGTVSPLMYALMLASPLGLADVFKQINAVLISSETAVWTPASGKKFRLMGGLLSVTGAAANVSLKDGIGGSTVWTLPSVGLSTLIPLTVPGTGILSGTANNVLTATGIALTVLNGVVWGREE